MKKVNIRELQHNFTKYLELAKSNPILVTKYGKEEAVLVNPKEYEVKEKKGKNRDIMKSKFIGMYKDKKEWKGKSSKEIAKNLREKAWYGKK